MKLYWFTLCSFLILLSGQALAGTSQRPFIVETGLFKPTPEAISQRYDKEHRHPAGEARLEVARGEAESFQVILPAYSGESLTAGRLELAGPGPNRYSIPQSALQVHRVGYVPSPAGLRVPDPLFDDLNMGDAKDPCALWFTLTVPSAAPAGDYAGSVTFSVDAKLVTVPVRLTVWDFELPKRSHLRTDFWFFRAQIQRYYGRVGEPGFREVSKYLELALDHRLTPIDCSEGNVQPLFTIYRETDGKLTIDWTKYDRYAQFVIDHGGNALSLAPTHWFCFWFSPQGGANDPTVLTDRATGKVEKIAYPYLSKEHLDMLKWYLRAAVEHFREKGWLQYAFVQPLDEVAENAETRAIVQACHDADPAVKVLMDWVTPNSTKIFTDYLGIWCPITFNLAGGGFDKVRAEGKDVWWYVACIPPPPHANLFTNQSAVEHRQLFWQSWKYGAQGVLYWGVNFWTWWGSEPKYDVKTAWPNSPWILGNRVGELLGDGYLIYPGPKGPLGSIRLEAIRDGIEDYEYLWLLNDRVKQSSAKKAVAAKQLLAIPESFCKDLVNYSRSEDDLLKLRRQVAGEILTLKHQSDR